jgi:hypothetical protein
MQALLHLHWGWHRHAVTLGVQISVAVLATTQLGGSFKCLQVTQLAAHLSKSNQSLSRSQQYLNQCKVVSVRESQILVWVRQYHLQTRQSIPGLQGCACMRS